MNVRSWIMALVAALLAPLLAAQALQLALLDQMVADSEQLARVESEVLQGLGRIQSAAIDYFRLSDKADLLADVEYRSAARNQSAEIELQFRGLIRLHIDAETLARLKTLHRSWTTASVVLPDAAATAARGGFVAGLQRTLEFQRGHMNRRLETARQGGRRARRVAQVAFGLVVPAALLGALLLARLLTRPMESLVRATSSLLAGRYPLPVGAGAGGELARLNRAFVELSWGLKERERLRRRSLASLSHDLKSPLAGMEESQTALLDGVAGPLASSQERLLRLNLDSNRRLRLLTERLLQWDRLENTNAVLHREAFRPGPLLEAAMRQAEAAEPEGPPMLLQESAGSMGGSADGDPVRLMQLFSNLCANARRHAHNSERILVRSCLWQRRPNHPAWIDPPPSHAGAWWVVDVMDRGPGIESELKPVVFAAYCTGAGHRRRHGLGLAICNAVAAAHGGALWVKDRAGGGSVFRVVLPWAEEVNQDG